MELPEAAFYNLCLFSWIFKKKITGQHLRPKMEENSSFNSE